MEIMEYELMEHTANWVENSLQYSVREEYREET